MELLPLFLIFICGLAAGFINVMAGGGSVLTVSALIFSGLDANMANGTNRVGIFVESGSAVFTFKKAKVLLDKKVLLLALSAIPGAILGAIYAINIDEALFQKVFSLVIIFVAITIFRPTKSKKTEGQRIDYSKAPEIYWYAYPLIFLVGIYGGFVQAGVGLLIISTLKLSTNANLVHISAIKSCIVFLYTIPALIIFLYGSQVSWPHALVLALGFSLGARFSAKTALKKGDRIVKRVLGIALLVVAIRLFTF